MTDIPREKLEKGWLIWSNYHRAYWGPNGGGYANLAEAGRYTLKDALEWCGQRSVDRTNPRSNPPELVVPSPELVAALLAESAGPKPEEPNFRDITATRCLRHATIPPTILPPADQECGVCMRDEGILTGRSTTRDS